jgi:hypothetical protein
MSQPAATGARSAPAIESVVNTARLVPPVVGGETSST